MANTKWVCGWGTAIDTTTQTITDYIEDITFRYVIYPTMPASAVRLHFSNLYGTEEVTVDKVFVAKRSANKEAKAGTSVEVLFDNILDDWANADHSQNQGLYVQVTNIPDTGVTGITVTPWFEAEGTGVKVTMGAATRSDAKVDATAIFGTFPTDLIVKK